MASGKQLNQDETYLRILSICYYVEAGILALTGCLMVASFFIFLAEKPSMDVYTELGKLLFVGFWILFLLSIACTWAMVLCVFLGGRYLSRREHYTFCLVAAVASCVCFTGPFGMVVGAFTIIVLSRPSVKLLFKK